MGEIMSESIGEMVECLNSQIVQLQSWLKCRHMKPSTEDKEQLEQISTRIRNLECTVSAMDDILRKEEESLIFMERMSESLELLNKKQSYIHSNLPQQLPVISDHYKLASNALSTIIQQSNNIYRDQTSSPQISTNNNNQSIHNNQRRKTTSNRNNKRKALQSMDDNPRAIKRRKINASNNNNRNKEIPQIEIVGKDQFDSVPKYVKSRLTQTRLNDAINEFNKQLLSKYRVIQMNPSKMNKHQYDLHEKYLKEETNETKKSFWLSHDDFKDSTLFTFDQTGKAIFNVMRHLKRIKMISGKKPKYVVL